MLGDPADPLGLENEPEACELDRLLPQRIPIGERLRARDLEEQRVQDEQENRRELQSLIDQEIDRLQRAKECFGAAGAQVRLAYLAGSK